MIIIFLIDGPRRLLIGYCLKGSKVESFGVIQFNVTKHVLDIVYSQTICWLALFFAPLITLVTVLKFIVVYYLRIFYINYVSNNRILSLNYRTHTNRRHEHFEDAPVYKTHQRL